jgi:rubrerythrin
MLKRKQELWLKVLYSSFVTKNKEIADVLEDFAFIEFRHYTWVLEKYINEKKEFDFDIDEFYDKSHKTTFDIYKDIVEEMKSIREAYPAGATYKRIASDEEYFIDRIENFMKDETLCEVITAFENNRTLPNKDLNEGQTGALEIFLTAETFKEYELTILYSYLNAIIPDKVRGNTFMTLAHESIFHMKKFCEMSNKMGILSLVRSLPKELYQNINLIEYLQGNINEEVDARRDCEILSEKIGDKELGDFFMFIANEETYHIELLTEALNITKAENE